MARYFGPDNDRAIETDGGMVWRREPGLLRYQRGSYQAKIHGVWYELRKHKRGSGDRPDLGWYLHLATEPDKPGEWCARTIIMAVEVAADKIHMRTEQNST